MTPRIHPITPLSSRYRLTPAAALMGAALLVTLVWANTGSRRPALHASVHPDTHAPTQPHTATHPPDDAGERDADRPAVTHHHADAALDGLLQSFKTDASPQREAAAQSLATYSPYVVLPRLGPWVDEQLADGSMDDATASAVLGLYRGWRVSDTALLEHALASPSAALQAQGVRSLAAHWATTPDRYALLTAAADDASPEVRSEVLRLCALADNARAAGIAELTRGHPMDDALTALYDTTIARLARHGPPIPAASRSQRVRAMSIDQLLDEPRDAVVLNALLLHPDLPAESFEATLTESAEASGREPTAQLIAVLSEATPEQLQRKPALGLALAHRPIDALAPQADQLVMLAHDERKPAWLYAVAASMRLTLRDDRPAALQQAREQLGDVSMLGAVALVPEPAVRDRLLPLVTPLIDNPPADPAEPDAMALYLLAIRALPHIPAASANLFPTLAPIARDATDPAARFTAIEVLDAIPQADWPAGHDDLVLTRVTLRTVPNQMLYDPKAITVPVGRPVVLELVNPDTMDHNLLIAAPGRLTDVGLDAAMLGEADGAARDYIPDSPHVLHATGIVKPGETAALRFIAPDTPGDYPYVCTYPGHWMTMNGVMHVVEP